VVARCRTSAGSAGAAAAARVCRRARAASSSRLGHAYRATAWEIAGQIGQALVIERCVDALFGLDACGRALTFFAEAANGDVAAVTDAGRRHVHCHAAAVSAAIEGRTGIGKGLRTCLLIAGVEEAHALVLADHDSRTVGREGRA